MQSKSPVEIADKMSRNRAILVAVAALVFLLAQAIGHPFIGADTAHQAKLDWWAVSAVVFLLLFATGGGLLNKSEIRQLVNDEVSRSNYRTSVIVSYWLAMTVAMVLYVVPSFRGFDARETIYFIVTPSIAVALLTFSFLELRAHRDA